MANKRIMTPEEKVLLQAKHRLEEIEARNRKKERNARTRRLIQEDGAGVSIPLQMKLPFVYTTYELSSIPFFIYTLLT